MLPSLSWLEHLDRKLPLLGHRNWIGVVDSAYPLQTRPGVELLATGADHVTVLEKVSRAVERAPHVRARVLVDQELAHLSETAAPGIEAIRSSIALLFAGQEPTRLPHEAIIARLDAAAQLFHVLLFKTTLALPYTSVFLELDCGYWSDEAERTLRASMPLSS